ncbi:MAG: lipid-binding SYLF domain-containing protein [Pseudomonadota bacterium]
MKNNVIKRVFLSGLAVMAVLTAVCAFAETAAEPFDQQALVDRSRLTFQSFMLDERMAWFRDNMHKAEGFLIIPEMLKGGFVVGASWGNGVLIVRNKNTGEWSQPAFFTISAGSVGLQIGGEMSEVIMMVKTRKGLDRMGSSSFKLGTDVSMAVGPVGGGVKGDILADFVSFVRSKGAFFGASIEGAVLKVNDKWNRAYYGRDVTPVDIVETDSVSNPGSAGLREAVREAYMK